MTRPGLTKVQIQKIKWFVYYLKFLEITPNRPKSKKTCSDSFTAKLSEIGVSVMDLWRRPL